MRSRTSVLLGCTGDRVLFDDLRPRVITLLNDPSAERTFVQLSSLSVPLCQQDVCAVEVRAVLGPLYEQLAALVAGSARRPLGRSTNSTVRCVLQWSATALTGCTELLRYLDATGFKEGYLDFDKAARAAADEVGAVLQDLNDQPYSATPLPVMAALVEGGLGCSLAALLRGRDVAELARRGALFYQVLQLVRHAARLPDVAQLLATPTRQGGQSVSVLGCLSVLAEGPASRVLLDWEWEAQRGVPLRPGGGEQELQRKMARRVRETHSMLASAVQACAERASAITSAQLPAPSEVGQLDALITQLQAARGGQPTSAPAATAAAPTSQPPSSYAAASPYVYPGPGNDNSSSSSYSTAAYGGYYGQPQSPAQSPAPRSPEPVYSVSSPSSQSLPASHAHSYSITTSPGPLSSREAAEAAVAALRIAREVQRLQAAAPAAGQGGGSGGGGRHYVRDGRGHHSQSEELAPQGGPHTISSLSYPWQVQSQQQHPQQQQQHHARGGPAVAWANPAERSGPGSTPATMSGYQQSAGVLLGRTTTAATSPREGTSYDQYGQQQQFQYEFQQQHSHRQNGSQQQQQQQSAPSGRGLSPEPWRAPPPDGQSFAGQHLGGYSLLHAEGLARATVSAASRPRSATRSRMPPLPSDAASTTATYPGAGGSGASDYSTTAFTTTAVAAATGNRARGSSGAVPVTSEHSAPHQHAWTAAPSVYSAPSQPAVQQQQQARQSQPSPSSAPGRQESSYVLYTDSHARSSGGSGRHSSQPAAAAAAAGAGAARAGSSSRMRLVPAEAEAAESSGQAGTWEPGLSSGQEAARVQQARSHVAPSRRRAPSSNSSSSSEEWPSSLTLRATAVAAGLIPGTTRPPRELRRQQQPQQQHQQQTTTSSAVGAGSAISSSLPTSTDASNRLRDAYLELEMQHRAAITAANGSHQGPQATWREPAYTTPATLEPSPPTAASSTRWEATAMAHPANGTAIDRSVVQAILTAGGAPEATRRPVASAPTTSATAPHEAWSDAAPAGPSYNAAGHSSLSRTTSPYRPAAATSPSASPSRSRPLSHAAPASPGPVGSLRPGHPDASRASPRPAAVTAAATTSQAVASDARALELELEEYDAEQLRRALVLSRKEAEARAVEEAQARVAAAVARSPRSPVTSNATMGVMQRDGGPSGDQRQQPDEGGGGGGGGGMLVGSLVPLTVLHQRYAQLDPLLCAKLVSLEDDFPRTRRVAGDGNCFYRAALFALLEAVLAAPDPALGARLEAVIAKHLASLDAPLPATPRTAVAGGTRPSPRGGTATTPLGSPRDHSPGRFGGLTAVDAGVGDGADGLLPPRNDPSAYRGGQQLLHLLRTAWYRAPDAAAPCDVSSLERLFNHNEQSADVIRFIRSLTVRELAAAADFYAPFIPGCGGDYSGMDLRQICTQHVLRMGVEVEQLQIMALCTALGAPLAVLDVAGSQVGAVKHGPAGHPAAWVAHLPGHYDIVYPARRLDVAQGGALIGV